MIAPNKFKTLLLASFITTCFSACDLFTKSDDDDEVADTDPNISEPALQSVSGKTADGYLVGAKVCVDLNNNSVCDDGEPTGISTEGGAYIIEDIDENVDLTNARVIVEVIPNQTIDEDFPDNVIEKAYTLTSPPGKPEFVSPITTIVDAVLQNDDSITIEEAVDQVKEDLGFSSESDVNVMDDYVEASTDETDESAEEYKKLHVVAQVTTEIIAQSLSGVVSTNADLTSDEQFSATLNAVVTNVEEKLEELVEVIDEVIENTDGDTDISDAVLNSDAVTFVAEETQLDATEVEEKIVEIEEEKDAASSDVETLLTQGEGFFFLDSDDDYYWYSDNESCIVEYEFDYNQFKIVEGVGQDTDWYFDFTTNMFIQEVDDDDNIFSFYQLGRDSWELVSEASPEVVSFSADGETLTVEFPGQGSRNVVATQIDLSGKPLSDVKRVDETWGERMSDSALFPSDSTMYSLSMSQVDDVYMVPFWSCDSADGTTSDTGENCNNIWKEYRHTDSTDDSTTVTNDDGTVVDSDGTQSFENQKAVTLAELINSDWDGDISSLVMFGAPFEDNYNMLMALISETEGTETNRYSLFFERNYDCYDGYYYDAAGNQVDCEKFYEKGSANWSTTTMSGQELLTIDLISRSDMREDFSGMFLTEVDGYVRVGMYIEAGTVFDEENALNETALESVIDGFMLETTTEELSKEYCGIFDDQHDDDQHDDDKNDDGSDNDGDGNSDNGDGTNDDRDEQDAPPTLTSDSTLTASLSGLTFIMEDIISDDESETIMLQFNSDTKVRGVVNEYEIETDAAGNEYDDKHEEAFDGTWIIDAQGQLLLNFEEQHQADDGTAVTYHNWVLLEVIGDIGDTLNLVDITSESDDMGDELTFTKLTPFILQSQLIIERTDDNETCKLDLTFTGGDLEGTGTVDTTSCLEMEDEGTLEFKYIQGDVGQIIIEILETDGSSLNSVEFFSLGSSTMYLISQGTDTDTDDDGTVHTHMFADIEKWTVVAQ